METVESDVAPLLHRTQARLFGAHDTVCLERATLVTEADRTFAAEPAPVRRALSLAHILRHMTLDLDTNPVFAGNTSTGPRAWMLVPEFAMEVPGQIQVEHDHLHARWLDDKVPPEIVDYWKPRQLGRTPGGPGGIGHMSIDFGLVVNDGLDAVLDRLRADAGCGTEAQQTYRRAMILACEAVLQWAERYARAADDRARSESDRVLAACYQRTADACRHVPRRPARTFFEGLQAMLLAHLATIIEGQGMSQSIGLADRVLDRFAAEVAADPEGAAQLVSAFILAVAGNSFMGRGSKTQAVTIGGADAHGRDRSTAVTMAFLDAFSRTPVGDPHLFLRWHRQLDPRIWERCVTMLSDGRSMPLLINDHVVAPGLEDLGVAPQDAWQYCIAGCNEIGIPGRATRTAFALGASVVDVALLLEAMRQSADQIASTDDLLAAYESNVESVLRSSLPAADRRFAELAQRGPFPFTSACCRGTGAAGADYLLAMPYSDIETVFVRGTSNAVDALAAIEQLVFRRRRITLTDLLAALDRQDEQVLALLRDAPKWGNDDPAADHWALRLHEARERGLARISAERGHPVIVCHVIRSLHHLSGRPLGATPDGRRAGQSLADSIGPVQGSMREGPTAMLNSVLQVDARRFYRGAYNLNLTLSSGQAAPDVLGPLCRAFLADGGQELQVNVLNAARLKEAQCRPEAFQDLVVRIAGLNARFVELSRLEQDEIIRRAEAVA